jgi:Type III restriction enzyme, res subunit
MIMACGTGKTLTALFIKEKLAAQRTLVLVPSLSLLAQTLRGVEGQQTGGIRFLGLLGFPHDPASEVTRGAKGTLDADREHRLQDLPGWSWKASSRPTH